MIMVDCNTGERQKVDFLGKDEVLGLDCKDCWDKIIKISSDDHYITLLVRRNKNADPVLETNPFNEDFLYEIKATYENDRINTKPLTSDSIVKRGPWPKLKISFPPGPYTAADLDLLYGQYGQKAVDEALLIKEMYYD